MGTDPATSAINRYLQVWDVSNVFVMGASVRGGYVGDQPSLTDLDNGDLRSTVDFRAVYGDLLRSVLDADPSRVLDKQFAPLGLFA